MKTLIVDIDDTLFDWLSMWNMAFQSAFGLLQQESKLGESVLLDAIRALHVDARTSERGFCSADATALGVRLGTAKVCGERFEDAAAVGTVPFASVTETLRLARERGAAIVLHTNCPPVLATERVVALGLEGQVDAVFATEQPATVHRTRARTCSDARFEVLRHPKPSGAALREILTRLNLIPEQCIYVGDSKAHDIPMAREVGVLDVQAAYGCRRDSKEYELLRRVSHWTDDEIAHEKSVMTMEATHAIDDFAEVLSFLR